VRAPEARLVAHAQPGSRTSRLRALLELTRPPNLLTAAADVLAGFGAAALTAPRALPWLVAATICLYAGGVTLNDVLDRRLDAVERPERPLPSGRASTAEAAVLAIALLGAGVALALAASPVSAGVAALIAGCAAAYDAWAKHHPLAGPAFMGACRGLNLLLGLSAAPALLAHRWPLAAIPLLYVAAVTTAGRGEVTGGTRGALVAVLGLFGAAGAAVLALAVSGPPATLAAIPFLLLLGWRLGPPLRRAWRAADAGSLRAVVGAGVMGLVLLDAAIAALYAGVLYPLAILALLPAAWWLARAFAVT
jgi:4-hydroxybenzoate polyprenyltransferase